MNTSSASPNEIFERPEAWFAGFGISVTQVSGHRSCPICNVDDLDQRIAA